MPMIDALWPEDALTPEAEARLVKELTDILIRAEGYDPANPIAQRAGRLARRRLEKARIMLEAVLDAASAG